MVGERRHLERVGAGGPAAPPLSCRRVRLLAGDRAVLDGVTLDVRAGEVYGLFGPPGSGRSSLARVACGLQDPDDGQVLLGGCPAWDLDPAQRAGRAGHVARSVVVVPGVTLAQTVRLWAGFLGLSGAGDRVPEVLHRTGLESRAQDRVDRSTGGTLRELAVAVALLTRPALLVLDEPAAGIDPAARDRVLETVARLGSEGAAVLYAAEHVEETYGVCTTTASIVDGRLTGERSPLATAGSSIA